MLRLKEIYSNISQDKERLAEENRQLKQLLAQNGMSMTGALPGGSILDETTSNPSLLDPRAEHKLSQCGSCRREGLVEESLDEGYDTREWKGKAAQRQKS